MTRIVVLGGSFGGLTAAFELKRLLGKKADVTVISDDDRFVFLPSLPWLIMGWRKAEDITLRLSKILKPTGINFIHEAAKQVDADSSKVYTTTRGLSYDYLVISTGPHLAFDEIPRGLNRLSRAFVIWIFVLEVLENTFGTIAGERSGNALVPT